MQRLGMLQARVLREAVRDGLPLGERFAVGMTDPRRQLVTVVSPDNGGQERQQQVSPQAWATLWPIFQVAKRASNQDALNGRRWLLAASGDGVWLCKPDELGALWATPAAGANAQGVVPELRPNDPLGIVPLPERTFDTMLLYGGPVPHGVRFLSIEDQDGVIAVMDGPLNPGNPVVNMRVRQLLEPLLNEALAIPGASGLVISTATNACFAVTMAALESVNTRQAMPVRRQATALDRAHEVVSYIPDRIHVIANGGRQLVDRGDPLSRALAFLGFLLFAALGTFCLLMLKTLVHGPVADTLSRLPGIAVWNTAEFAAVAFGMSITLSAVLAWGPFLLQMIGLVFSRMNATFVYVFWAGSTLDVFGNTQYWLHRFWPEGLGWLNAYEGMAPLLKTGCVAFAAVIGLLNSIGNEWGLILSITMVVVLWPGFVAAIGMAFNQVLARSLWVDLPLALRRMGDDNRVYRDARHAQYQLPTAEPFVMVIDSPEVIYHQQNQETPR